jgi:anti-sigma regulatory factor (Ser/Thr protein kinase)
VVTVQTTCTSHWEHTYPVEPREVRNARHAIEGFLSRNPRVEDAGLIVTEFATNAVLYSDGGGFVVRAEVHQDHVRLECEDGGGIWHMRHDDGRPHGLDIVRALCGDGGWGTEETSEGRMVWARLDLDRSGT